MKLTKYSSFVLFALLASAPLMAEKKQGSFSTKVRQFCPPAIVALSFVHLVCSFKIWRNKETFIDLAKSNPESCKNLKLSLITSIPTTLAKMDPTKIDDQFNTVIAKYLIGGAIAFGIGCAGIYYSYSGINTEEKEKEQEQIS